jgi:hypothetical protein
MTLLREALEATLTNRPFVENEILAALPEDSRPLLGTPVVLHPVDGEDREAVTVEVRTLETLLDGSRLQLHAFPERADAEHTYEVMHALRDAGFDEGSRHRVLRPVALMAEDCLVVSSGRPGTPLARLIEGRSENGLAMITEAGRWLGSLHTADVRIGTPWWPWQSVTTVGARLKPQLRRFGRGATEVGAMVRRLALPATQASVWSWTQTHGRFRPDRVLVGRDGVTVDDFVRSAPGDPARDVAEFLVHLRRRAIMEEDPRASVLEPAFLDGYLAVAPAEHLANLGFYAGCAILTSLVSEVPPMSWMPSWIDFHLAEFDRYVPDPAEVLKPTA